MKPPRTTIAVDDCSLLIQITDDGSRTLIDPATGVAYHSAAGAMTETRHVYLHNSGVAARLQAQQPTSVLEIGLGTGMGMLMTLDLAIQHAAPLHYTAIENHWLPAEVLQQLQLQFVVSDPAIVAGYLEWRRQLTAAPTPGLQTPGFHSWQAGPQQSVRVFHGDVADFADAELDSYDAIYFDPFAPDANPQLWQAVMLRRFSLRLAADGRLVTYCVSRQAREALQQAGFAVTRVPGPPGGKREVLVATLSADGHRAVHPD